MLENITRVIFDLDNTLIKHEFDSENFRLADLLNVDNKKKFKEELSYMFKNHGKYLKKGIVTKERVCWSIEECMPILKEESLTGEDVLDAIHYVGSGKLMDGADELLYYLQAKGYQIVALTNWFLSHQTYLLKKLDILQYFERIYAWDDFYAKPHHLAMIRALENTNASENVIIGDDPIGDIAGAKKFGIRTIGFNIDYDKYKGKASKADISVKSLAEIKWHL